ncbi:aspartate aminotransferase family protein [Mangrovactinospora gilvigrisea]|uniref:Aspartate aminotransferase family protein n=1 Tax=Mangrovactinospora gilvigrisea TaxID=1428644 RepID=A0A1J7BSL4_9ACTN|nr:pyridoxal-dependent decarboxylase [Mangrovactinospora gilvigrisea]OIV36449.1 aspartate aminotransferase family protein [Mangrovactinospora gilvigrisea]
MSTDDLAAPAALAPHLGTVLDALAAGAATRNGPLPAGGPAAVAEALGRVLADTGGADPLRTLTTALAAHSVDPLHPDCAAHLHCPPLAVAVAADLAASAVNASLDSWDQAPAAIEIENDVLRSLAGLVGYGPRAAGVLTTGGTESNLMGLLLARDSAPDHHRATRTAVFASTAAHFSVARNASLLGLPPAAVHLVPTDDRHRMDPAALHAALRAHRARTPAGEGAGPSVVVATAGTTDLGAVDPLRALAETAHAHGASLHVDAAYGGGALFSERLRPLLDGLPLADTIALDLHKLGWQPVPAGVFLARDAARFDPLEARVAYLNAQDDEDEGYLSPLGRSLRTTRRADAFKLAVTLRALGRDGLGRLVDRCHDLARHAAARIAATPGLELTAEPVLTTVVFRCTDPRLDASATDEANARARRALLAAGRAVVGRTELGPGPGAIRLKLTLLNPHTTEERLDALVDAVAAAGREAAAEVVPATAGTA